MAVAGQPVEQFLEDGPPVRTVEHVGVVHDERDLLRGAHQHQVGEVGHVLGRLRVPGDGRGQRREEVGGRAVQRAERHPGIDPAGVEGVVTTRLRQQGGLAVARPRHDHRQAPLEALGQPPDEPGSLDEAHLGRRPPAGQTGVVARHCTSLLARAS